jgi:ubiquinone/menaquinone biosynthesis C-methylase UbiE
LLTRFARCAEPPVVVDLGCGTGLSTRPWVGHARQIIGVDCSAAMLEEARRSDPTLTWVLGRAEETTLGTASADIVVAVQSFHWMDPRRTLPEIARILRPGGVFAAVDTDLPPAIHPELDRVFEQFLTRAAASFDDPTPRWSKTTHLERLYESGLFRHVREVQLHRVEQGDAERFVGLAESAVELPRLLALGTTAEDLGLDALRDAAERILGRKGADWLFGFLVRIAVK